MTNLRKLAGHKLLHISHYFRYCAYHGPGT